MTLFINDYSEGCHERILEALTRTNRVQTTGYGTDPYCAEARDILRRTRQHVERKRVPQIEIDCNVLRLQAMGKPRQQRGLDPIQHQLVMRLDVLVEQDGERPPVRLQPPQRIRRVAVRSSCAGNWGRG